MEKNTKSKITVIGFVVFVLSIYTGSYFYTKSNNERLLSAPRIVLLIGSEEEVNKNFTRLTSEQRRAEIRSMLGLGLIYSLSQTQYDAGVTDIVDHFGDVVGDTYTVSNCLEYSELLKRTMARDTKTVLKASWIFSACGIIE